MARPPPAPQQPGLFGVITPRGPSLFNPQPWRFGSDPLIAALAPRQPDKSGYVAGPGGALLRRRLGLDPSAAPDPSRPKPWGLSWGADPVTPDEAQAWLERRLDTDSFAPGRMSPREAAARATLPRTPITETPVVEPLLRQISQGEGTDDETARKHGYASGYDVIFYGSPMSPRRPLTQMPLDMVMRMQEEMRRLRGSDAVGKYQFQGPTLARLKAKQKLRGDEPFDKPLQERLGRELLKERGVDKYGGGAIDLDTLMKALSKEWTSIEDPTNDGRTHDERRPRTTAEQIRAATAKLRPLSVGQTQLR